VNTEQQPPPPKAVAVIELGTTSVRMTVGQPDQAGGFHILDSLQQAVSTGKDTFTAGRIEKDTIEECGRALRRFHAALKEYGITDNRQIRAVATTAVREASNSDAFLDRIYIATGIDVDVIDEAEISRYTYLAVRPLIEVDQALKQSTALVVEVGGGSTETLVIGEGILRSADSYRLGSLRLMKTLEEQRAPTGRLRQIMQTYIDRAVALMKQKVPSREDLTMLAIGADVRFAAGQLHPDWDKKGMARFSVSALSKFTDSIVQTPVDELVRTHHMSFPDAETLGPALLVYTHIAKALGVKNILVGNASLRDGILTDMTGDGAWADEFRQQIIASALEIGRKYHFDEANARQTSDLVRQLFQALQQEHGLESRYEMLICVAALLHDIGNYVSNRSHHKHSMYLIVNSEIFGLSKEDILLTALTARYHRRALPRPTHEYYSTLNREDRIIVSKLAAILRIADALSKGYSTEKRNVRVNVEPGRMTIDMDGAYDLALEEYALAQKREMFEQVYGIKVVLRS
jgi:exopolyphosphatase/guanosine-5'-triphosphate,3'-diphosphate pyrophosphatase